MSYMARTCHGRYLHWDEVQQAAKCGKSVIVFQHWNREQRDGLVARLSNQLRSRLPAGGTVSSPARSTRNSSPKSFR
jgi:hypothetical protein